MGVTTGHAHSGVLEAFRAAGERGKRELRGKEEWENQHELSASEVVGESGAALAQREARGRVPRADRCQWGWQKRGGGRVKKKKLLALFV